LQHAKIFYTVYGSDAEKKQSAEIIENNKGLIRREVGRGLSIRLTPTIEFESDEIPVIAAHLNDLLHEAKARDAEVQELAKSAEFAGEANPYKEPKSQEEAE
jgi:ribosome-binding factor A